MPAPRKKTPKLPEGTLPGVAISVLDDWLLDEERTCFTLGHTPESLSALITRGELPLSRVRRGHFGTCYWKSEVDLVLKQVKTTPFGRRRPDWAVGDPLKREEPTPPRKKRANSLPELEG
jgi:hypothetical protein